MHDFFTVTIHKLKVHLQCPLPFPSRPGQFPSFWLAPWMKFLQGRSSSFLPCTRRSVLACLPHWSQWMANASCRTVLQGHQNDDQSDVWHLQHTNIHAGGRKKKKRLLNPAHYELMTERSPVWGTAGADFFKDWLHMLTCFIIHSTLVLPQKCWC